METEELETEQPEQPEQPAEEQAPMQQPGARPQVNPRMVEMHQRIVGAAMKILYSSGPVVKQVLQMVASAEDPAEGVAAGALVVVEQVKNQAKGLPNPNFAYTAVMPVAMMVIELAQEAKIIKPDPKLPEQVLNAVLRMRGGQQQPPPQGDEPEEQPEAEAPRAGGGIVSEEMEA